MASAAIYKPTTTAALEAAPTLKQQTTGERQWQSFATSQSIHGW